jgi:hypothetical protein
VDYNKLYGKINSTLSRKITNAFRKVSNRLYAVEDINRTLLALAFTILNVLKFLPKGDPFFEPIIDALSCIQNTSEFVIRVLASISIILKTIISFFRTKKF